MAESQRVTVIGLGLMGTALARRLIATGHEVTVWNRSPDKAESLRREGAMVATTLEEAVAAGPVSLWCLIDYPTTAALIADPDVTAALRGRTVIPSATGGPRDVALVADAVTAADAMLLDAKIMFFPAGTGADDAELLLSGSADVFARYDVLLADLAGVRRYLGSDPTRASVLYTAVWAYDFAARFAYMEAAALVEASGLDPAEFASSAAARTAQFGEQNAELDGRFETGDFEGDQATVDVYAEGMAPMLGAFSSVGSSSLMLEAVAGYARAAQAAGDGLKDVSAVFDVIRRGAV